MKRLKIILQSNWFYYSAIIFLCLYCFIFTKVLNYKSVYSLNDSELTGRIIDYNIDGNKLSLIVNGKEKVKATYYIKDEKEKAYLESNLLLGSIVNLSGSFSNPLNNTIPNTFNYKNYLSNKGIYSIFKVETYELNNKISLLYKAKNFVLKRINTNEELSAYFKTFILGDKREISSEDYSNYQINGISHLLAISGMHIGLFSSMLFFILKKLKLDEKKSFVIVFTFLLFYAFLTSYSASILRALVFMLFLNLNKIYYLKISSIKCLFLTTFIIVLFSPLIIYDLGFQYSSITVFGLLLASDYIKGSYVQKLFKTSLVAFIFSFPLTIYNFYEINLLSPILNIIFVPFVSFVLYPLILLNFVFPFLTDVSLIVLQLLDFLNKFSASLDFFIINIPKISVLLVFLLYILLLLFIKTKRKVIIILILNICFFIKYKPFLDNSAYVYFLDVGQGDSSLLISPNRRNVVMIDTGGVISFNNESWKETKRSYTLSYNTISFLKSLGINKIDLLILSHGDYDHMGEAINLINNLKIEKVVFNCSEFNKLEKDLINFLDQKKIPHYSCIKELDIDDNKLYFLNNGGYGNENDNSSVIYTNLYNHKFLFMGDAGVEVEEDLIEKYNLRDINVLKVGHHGSKTSSSNNFIDEVNPKYSIISVGKNNRYGHPNDSVLDNLEDSKIYRTDIDGSVMFKIKKNKLQIRTCKP